MRSRKIRLHLIGVNCLALTLLASGCGYNDLQGLDEEVKGAWAEVQNQYQRRADLVPNLVEVVKGAAKFEQDTLKQVIDARSKATSVNLSVNDLSNPEAFKRFEEAQRNLSGALSRLLAVVESYPDLKATGNVAQLQEELTATENKIGFSRQLYNDTATQYNTKQQQFPTTLVAGLAKASPTDLWEIEDQAERAVPHVDLSRR